MGREVSMAVREVRRKARGYVRGFVRSVGCWRRWRR